MRIALSAVSVCALSLGAAQAAEPIELDVEGQITVVAGVSENTTRIDADGDITFRASTAFENGVEVGAVVEGRFDREQPGRLFAGGRYTSLLAGGPRGVGPLNSDAFVQGAYAYARGGFGEVIVGRDHGVGRTFAVTAPTVFRAISVNDWRTDFSGLNDVHTVNDFSGYSTKLTYLPPANFLGGVVGGLQLGVSYAPRLGDCDERLCAPEGGFLVAPDGSVVTQSLNYRNVVEAAAYYQTPLSSDVLLGIGASYVTADEDDQSATSVLDDYEAFSLGLNLAYRGVTVGGSVKTTNAGVISTDDEDGYLAFDAGITFQSGEEKGDWAMSFVYGQSQASVFGPNLLDPSLFRDTQTAQAGFTYFVSPGITIGAAAQFINSDAPAAAGGPEEATTVVIESSIQF